MSQTRKALVLHLAGNSTPVLIEIDDDTAAELGPQLVEAVRNGDTRSLTGVNGTEFAVNFGHVATAHFEDVSKNAVLYGSIRKGPGE